MKSDLELVVLQRIRSMLGEALQRHQLSNETRLVVEGIWVGTSMGVDSMLRERAIVVDEDDDA